MTEYISISREEKERLEERVKRSSIQKSHLELVVKLMQKVSALPGLENVLGNLLKSVGEVLGGTNIAVYYWLDDEIHYLDLLGNQKIVPELDDPLARRALELGAGVEEEHAFSQTKMLTREFTSAYTWAIPLLVHDEPVGVIRAENLHVGMRNLSRQLPTFFNYVALVLKNEILGHTRLKRAFDDLSQEMIARKQAELELLRAKEALEVKVEERTRELRRANDRLLEDISRRERAEESLRESERKLASALSMARLGHWELDAASGIFTFSDSFYDVFGTTAREMGGYHVSIAEYAQRFVYPDDSGRVAQETQKAIEARDPGYSRYLEHRIVRADGSVGYVAVKFFIVKNEKGETVKIYGVNQDVTERVHSAARLRDSEERYRFLLQHLPAGVIVSSPDMKILLANEEAARIFGAATDRMTGCGFSEVSSDIYRSDGAVMPWGEHPASLAASSGKPVTGVVMGIKVSGVAGRVWTLVSAFPDPGPRGDIVVSFVDITEYRRATAELQQTQERYRTILLTALSGFCLIDGSARISEVNQAYCNMTGYTSEELNGMHIRDIDALMSDEEMARRWSRIVARGYDRFETKHRRKDGTLFDVEASVQMMEGGTGWQVAFFRDITERKKAEVALRESEAKLRVLIDGLPDIIMRFDRNGHCLFISDNVEGYTGKDAAEYLGKSIRQMDLAPEVNTAGEGALLRVLASRKSFEDEIDVETRMGRRTFNIRMVPEESGEGAVASMLVIAHDITERRKAEEDFRILFQEMQDGFSVHEIIREQTGDPVEFRFAAVNPSFEAVTGKSGESILGRTMLEVLPGTESSWFEVCRAVAATGEPGHLECGLGLGEKCFEVKVFLPKPGQVACLYTDITQRRNLEEQFRQAQKMEAIGKLAGGVAHDFNNLLQVITVNTDLAKGEMEEGSVERGQLEEVAHAALRASELTRQLLAFSRRQIIRPVNTDLNEVVQDVIRMLRRVIGENIELRFAAEGKLGAVYVDRGQIEQVIMNLCVNSRDAMPRGGTLTIQTQNLRLSREFILANPWAKEESYVVLSVADTGTGMDAATRAHIFEPFFTTKGLGKGTGLGLATVYGIVQQSGGNIELESEPGAGSVFRVYLPVVDREVEEARAEVKQEIRGGNETILIAEDDAAILRILAKLLQRAGYTVITAGDGIDAVRRYEENAGKIDLVMLDVMMPGLSGREVMDRIQGLGAEVPFLFSSGYSEDAIHTDFVIHEGMHLIQKPYSQQVLLNAIRNVLDQAKV